VQLHISYSTSPIAWDTSTASWVLHLYTHDRIHCYQTSDCTIEFESVRDRNFAALVITDVVKMV